ncbi:MAG: hypothetical protein NXI21_08515 [Alphaproteobacteria bacterium]|nr:hypothetical protein [Alphaproteobacteria bacterium]
MAADPETSDAHARWRRLNAFVDGELDPRAAARTARAIADDPADARDAAALGELKAALGDAFADHAPQVPPALRASQATMQPKRRAWRRVAAAAVILLMAGATVWLAPFGGSQDRSAPAWVTHAVERHAALSERPAQSPGARLAATPVALQGFAPFVPDLRSGKLTVGRIESFTGPDGAASLAVNYHGTRGCRVTLVAFADGAAGLSERLERLRLAEGAPSSDAPAAQGFVWRVGGVRYLLIASGMDAGRFGVIAETVHRASQLHRPIDDEGRTLMADARANSAPCQA